MLFVILLSPVLWMLPGFDHVAVVGIDVDIDDGDEGCIGRLDCVFMYILFVA